MWADSKVYEIATRKDFGQLTVRETGGGSDTRRLTEGERATLMNKEVLFRSVEEIRDRGLSLESACSYRPLLNVGEYRLKQELGALPPCSHQRKGQFENSTFRPNLHELHQHLEA